jgi:hypothetical protein
MRALRKPLGKTGLSELLLLALIAGVIYGAWVFSPAVLDNIDVKEAISVAYNSAGKLGDAQLKLLILQRLGKVGTHEAEDDHGEIVERKGLGLTHENILIERNEPLQTIRIGVEYERVVRLKPTSRVKVLSFSPEHEGPIIR